MPPAFVLSQNQTLKLMYDKLGRNRPKQAGISGSRSCTNSQSGVFAYLRHMSRRCEASLATTSIRNGINLTDRTIPRGYRRPGRRPHVPSSKPTMSKSRRASSPGSIGSGRRLADLEEARNERETLFRGPRPLLEAAYMGECLVRQPAFLQICCKADDGPPSPQWAAVSVLNKALPRPFKGQASDFPNLSREGHQALWI
jgi:hypothetical protein